MVKDEAATGNSLAELEGIVKDCKKKPHNFALLKAKDGVVLKAHPLKSSEVMFRAAKDAGGIPAIGMTGTMIATGKTLEMTLETEEFPASLPKLAKKHFTAMKLPLKIVVILPNGQRVETGDDDEGSEAGEGQEVAVAEQVSEAAATQDDPDAARKAALSSRIKAVVPRLREAAGQGLAGVDKLSKAVQAAAVEMANNGLDRAEKLVEAAEAGLRQLTDGSAGPVPDEAGLRQRLIDELSGMTDDLRGLLQGADRAVAGKATQLIGMFKAEIHNDLKKSEQILSLLRKIVGSGELEGEEDEGDEEEEEDDDVGDGDKDASGKDRGKKGSKKKSKKKKTSSDPGTAATTAPVRTPDELASDLEQRSPAAGREAKAALAAFDLVLKGAAFDEAALTAATAKVTSTSDERDRLYKEWQNAKKLDASVADRDKQIEDARLASVASRKTRDEAIAIEKAIRSKALLASSMATGGALAADTKPAYSAAAQQALVKGIIRNPTVTGAAITACETLEHRDAMALNLDKILGQAESGFQSGDKSFTAAFSDKYAGRLLKAGANAGPEYFARLDDYLASGRQLEPDPTGSAATKTWNADAQARGLHIGKGILKPDGSVDVDSAEAKNAIGDVLFHPKTVESETPALNSHVLKTVDMLRDPVKKQRASDILKGIPAPTDPAAMGLVRTATGKGPTAAVGKPDAQAAVLGAMMKPLDQGNVGSCFSTAPARRMRETDPMSTMASFAQIAGTGRFKPPFGAEVPIVTNLPPDEDPIQRSYEYSLATATARRADSSERDDFKNAMTPGLEGLSKEMKGFLEGKKKTEARTEKLKQAIDQDIVFTYDPMKEISDSNDGSSDQGAYVLMIKGETLPLDSREKFCAAISKLLAAKLGLDAKSKDAASLTKYVASDKFVNAVCPGKYKPWELESGGQTEAATQTMFGVDIEQHRMSAKARDPKPTEPEQTAEVLKGFLNSIGGSTKEMETVRTVGMHGFNALPTHPSLTPLKGRDAAETEQKVKANLIDKGKALKDTVIPKEKAQSLYDQQGAELLAAEKDDEIKRLLEPALAANRVTGDSKPAAIDGALKAALSAANDRKAAKEADDWAGEQTAPVDPAKKAAKKAEFKADGEQALSDKLATRLLREMEGPQFVLADTNWGGPRDHTFFVVAPDPVSGEPVMWNKTVPPGTLTKVTRDWIDAQWAVIN